MNKTISILIGGKAQIITLLIMGGIVSVIIWSLNSDRQFLTKDKYYTIATLTQINHRRTKTQIDYTYTINGKKWTNGTLIYIDGVRNKLKVGDRFYIQFIPNDPKVSEIRLREPYPPDSINAPSSGWVNWVNDGRTLFQLEYY